MDLIAAPTGTFGDAEVVINVQFRISGLYRAREARRRKNKDSKISGFLSIKPKFQQLCPVLNPWGYLLTLALSLSLINNNHSNINLPKGDMIYGLLVNLIFTSHAYMMEASIHATGGWLHFIKGGWGMMPNILFYTTIDVVIHLTSDEPTLMIALEA
eukprot:scaffold205325_cov46-Prasinocladus_malaysianus.AAC.1